MGRAGKWRTQLHSEKQCLRWKRNTKGGEGGGVQGREFYNWYQMPSEANDLTNTVLIKQIP